MRVADVVAGLKRSWVDQVGLLNRDLLKRSKWYARAEIARSGVNEREAVVVTWEEWNPADWTVKHFTRVLRRDDRDLRERLWRLVHADAVTREAVAAALIETQSSAESMTRES